MEKLGPSLKYLRDRTPTRTFSLKTVTEVGIELLKCLEILHGHGMAHRDLKPANVLVGTKERRNRVFLIDFGLSKHITTTESGVVYPPGKVTGTGLYASINAHVHCEEARKADDIESLIYLLVFLLKGTLPWKF